MKRQRVSSVSPDKPTLRVLKLIWNKLDSGKAEQIKIRDIHRSSTLADYVVIATGTSPRHTMALGYHLEQTLRAKGLIPYTNAGDGDGNWVVVDLGYIIVHLLTADARAMYDLESLWKKGHPIRIPPVSGFARRV